MRRIAVVVALVGVAVVIVAAATRRAGPDAPAWSVEQPAGSGTWTPAEAPPGWVTNPPARDGYLRILVRGRSNFREIAAEGTVLGTQRRAPTHVERVLTPVVGAEDAARAGAAVPDALRLVERAASEQVLTSEPVLGNTLAEAWLLFEAAHADILTPLPPEKRAAAADALRSPGVVVWAD